MSWHDYLKFLFALLFVLGLMGGFAYLVRRLGLGGDKITPQRRRRLQIVETLPLSPRHKAVLIQRDGVEHLVILGASGDTVVETDIRQTRPDPRPETP